MFLLSFPVLGVISKLDYSLCDNFILQSVEFCTQESCECCTEVSICLSAVIKELNRWNRQGSSAKRSGRGGGNVKTQEEGQQLPSGTLEGAGPLPVVHRVEGPNDHHLVNVQVGPHEGAGPLPVVHRVQCPNDHPLVDVQAGPDEGAGPLPVVHRVAARGPLRGPPQGQPSAHSRKLSNHRL